METGHGWTDEALETIHDLLQELETGHGQAETGHGQAETRSWNEGIRYNAQCDGGNHYLYKMDKTAINPKTGHGYSKGRIYAGTFESAREKCPAYAANWQSKHICRAGRSGDGHGRDAGIADGGNKDVIPAGVVKPVRWQDFTIPHD